MPGVDYICERDLIRVIPKDFLFISAWQARICAQNVHLETATVVNNHPLPDSYPTTSPSSDLEAMLEGVSHRFNLPRLNFNEVDDDADDDEVGDYWLAFLSFDRLIDWLSFFYGLLDHSIAWSID